MIHWIIEQHVPLIYSMQVFIQNWNDQNVLKLPLISFAINLFSPNSQKLVLTFKKCCKNPILTDNDFFFFLIYFASWQRVAEEDVLWQKRQTDRMALACPLSLLTIQDVTMKYVGFLTLEAWLIRQIRTSRLPRQRALWYLRPIEAGPLRIRGMFHRAEPI